MSCRQRALHFYSFLCIVGMSGAWKLLTNLSIWLHQTANIFFWMMNSTIIDDCAKDGHEELFTKCIAFDFRPFKNFKGIWLKHQVHFGKMGLAAIFRVIERYALLTFCHLSLMFLIFHRYLWLHLWLILLSIIKNFWMWIFREYSIVNDMCTWCIILCILMTLWIAKAFTSMNESAECGYFITIPCCYS